MVRDTLNVDKLVEWKKVAIYTLLFIVNCIAAQNTTVGIVVAIVEAAYVIISSIFLRTESAILANNVFLGVSIEASLFVYGEYTYMYSYAYMPVVHRWGSLGCSLIILFCVMIKHHGKISIGSKEEIKKQWGAKFVIGLVLLIIVGLIVSLLNILANDNYINNTSWFFGAYVTEVCYWMILVVNLVLVYYSLRNNDNFYYRLRKTLIAFFLALVIAAWVSIAMGWHGTYSYHKSILLMPLVAFFSITTVIFGNFKTYKKAPLFIFAIAGLVSMSINTTPLLGKWILVVGITVITYLWLSLTRKQFLKVLALIILAYIVITIFAGYFISSNELLQFKIEQAMGSVSIGRGSWITNLSGSPKMRIEEFVNIFLEYLKKPWQAVLGKGIGGTITQHTNWSDWSSNIGAFSINQRQSGIYNELHESFNVLFLKFGILGLTFFVSNFARALKSIKKSPWILMGVIWFVFYINVYVSMYIVATAFLLGIYESDISDGLIQRRKDTNI